MKENCNTKLYNFCILFMIFVIGLAFSAEAQVVKHPLAELSTSAKHYKYAYNISPTQFVYIEYILVKASTGEVKSAFNACDVCYPYYKGYAQVGTKLRCKNCGNSYEIDALGSQGAGGCWPGHLVHTVEGDSVVLNVSDLAKGEYYFRRITTDVVETSFNNVISLQNIDNNELRITLNDFYPQYFKLYSFTGGLLDEITPSSNQFNMDISRLNSGLYFILTEYKGKAVSKYFYIAR